MRRLTTAILLIGLFPTVSIATAQELPPHSINGFEDDNEGADVLGAFADSLKLLFIEHGSRVAFQEKTRRELGGNFWGDYKRSVRIPKQWDDTDAWWVNYIGHPIHGAAAGYIWLDHEPGAPTEIGLNSRYWSSRGRATAWSAVYSLQFEIGPLSEASSGNVGIGTTGPTTKLQIVGGNCSDDPGGGGCTADFAEYYPSSEDVEKGDVVMVDVLASAGYSVRKSDGSGVVIGVVSTAPAAIADNGSLKLMVNEYELDPRRPAIALSGRVPVKVSLENGEIKPGDRLTASKTKPGHAMKQTEAGQSIGIALENLSSRTDSTTGNIGTPNQSASSADATGQAGAAKVLMFINLGYHIPNASELAQNKVEMTGGTVITIASGSPSITTTSSSGLTVPDVITALAETIMVKFQNIWAKGDVISQGIKKTYYALTEVEMFKSLKVDVGIMAQNWLTREIAISPNIDIQTQSLFSGTGAQAAGESKLDLAENGAYLATYGVDSTRGEIYLSGSSEITGGEAKIYFDFSFTSVISDKIPLKVLITPTTAVQGQLYVANKTPYGFVVKSLNGPGNGKFDWLVIARRRGYEGNDAAASQDDNIETFKDLNTGSASVSPEPSPTLSPELQTSSGSEPLTESATEETTASSSEPLVGEPVVEKTASSSETILTDESLKFKDLNTASSNEPLTQPTEPSPTASESL